MPAGEPSGYTSTNINNVYGIANIWSCLVMLAANCDDKTIPVFLQALNFTLRN